MRRAERKAAKKPKQSNLAAKAADAANHRAGIVVLTRDEAKSSGWNVPEEPGHGEIVGGEVSKLADTLAEMARKKGGTDAVQAELARLIHIARYEGQKAAEDRHMKTVKDLHEAHTDKIVCSAIAAFEMQMKEQGGLPPAITVSSYTICRMLDALNRAGYHADGKK